MRTLRFAPAISCWALIILLSQFPASMRAEQPIRHADGSLPTADGRAFYAAGTLHRVRRKDNGAERMALLNGQGSIRAFLAPNSRADIRAYVGQEVAVRGRVLHLDDDGENVPYVAVDHVASRSRRSSGVTRNGSRNVQTVSFADEQPARISTMEHFQEGPIFDSHWQAVEGETFVDGEYIEPPLPPGHLGSMGPGYVDGGYVDGGYVDGGYIEGGTCQGGLCGGPGPPSCGNCRKPGCVQCCPDLCDTCGPPGWLWVRGEYLIWSAEGMDLPPLVTTGAVADDLPGALGQPGTQILYGNESVLESGRSGFRINFGGWFGLRRCVGWEAEYLELSEASDLFTASSDDFAVLARPFVNLTPGAMGPNGSSLGFQDAELISFPDVVDGTVSVLTQSTLRSAAGRLRFNVCCKELCHNPCRPRRCGYPPHMKVDLTAGYRFASLDEGLLITEDLTSLDPNNPQTFEIFDQFDTRSEFNGGEVGAAFECGVNRWTWDLLMRIALGNVNHEVSIDGMTDITTIGVGSQTFPGGLLAQPSNIGTYSQNDFGMIPELASNVGLYLTPRLRWTVGYTFFYLSNVVRPGNQVDLDVNTEFVPPLDPITGLTRPEFVFRTTDFWAQGLNTGLDFRW